MQKTLIAVALAGAVAVFGWVLRPEPAPDVAPATGPLAPAAPDALAQVRLPEALSADAQTGKRAFDAICAACHGENAAGREGKGPPLVHKIYEPSHHADFAFQMAVRNGVKSHHWRFGDMPPVPGLTDAEIGYLTRYVRELQRANGIL